MVSENKINLYIYINNKNLKKVYSPAILYILYKYNK